MTNQNGRKDLRNRAQFRRFAADSKSPNLLPDLIALACFWIICQAICRYSLDNLVQTQVLGLQDIRILKHAFTPLILHKNRMRRRARTDLSGGRSVMSVPTGSRTPN